MHTVGIVCEYNPFHQGHVYQINKTKQQLGENTTIVCAMSGDFVQRGEAAVFDKFARAEAACRSGADLVVELPLPWCLSSAEGFAFGSVSILSALGCDILSFGSESANVEALSRIAAFVSDESAQKRIKMLLDADATLSFARARQFAAAEALGEETATMLSEPNDILAIEYLKSIRRIGSVMEPFAVHRIGAAHDSEEEGKYCSAKLLRSMVKNGEAPDSFIPEPAMTVFRREMAAGKTPDERLLEISLLSRLYRLTSYDFDLLPDAGGGAGRRLYDALWNSGSVEQIIRSASGKRYTAARMRRLLYCAALGICAEDTKGVPPYIRVLALNEKGRAHLSHCRKKTSIPVVNKYNEIRKLGFQAEKVFKICAGAHELYRLACPISKGGEPGEDWRFSPLIV